MSVMKSPLPGLDGCCDNNSLHHHPTFDASPQAYLEISTSGLRNLASVAILSLEGLHSITA